jgi:hypothetical protein
MATISIEYEKYQSNYRAVVVKYGDSADRQEKRFDGGMAEHDFPLALLFADSTGEPVMYSSSCDDFVRDGFSFGWKTTEQGEVLYRLTEEEIRLYHGRV